MIVPAVPMLVGMLELQDRMNRKISPSWLTAGYPFLRAVLVEAAEAMDHYGWKWWKSQTPNIPQLRIELVDIWHFVLSHYLVSASGDVARSAEMIVRDWGEVDSISVGGESFALKETDVIRRLELLAALACVRKTSLPLLSVLFDDCGLTPEVLYREYVSKNVLNHFRQDFGYKSGTYFKTWDGREDNEHLADIVFTLNVNSPDLPDQLYAELMKNYQALQSAGKLSA
jgi:hypothetical protein